VVINFRVVVDHKIVANRDKFFNFLTSKLKNDTGLLGAAAIFK